MKLFFALALSCCLLAPAAAENQPAPNPPAQAPAAPDPTNPASWLGLKPEEAYRILGAPAEISAVDDGMGHLHVVHYYPDFTYLFWFDNHVWQVRLDRRYGSDFLGLHMGMTSDDATAILTKTLGKSVGGGDNWTAWALPYQLFSRRLKVVFEDGKLVDAFFYRSDL